MKKLKIFDFGMTHPCPSQEGNYVGVSREGNYVRASQDRNCVSCSRQCGTPVIIALIALVCLTFMAGCKEQNKALVSAHNAVGELLISTQGQTKTLYTQGVINKQTYEKIRVNWLMAQKSYLNASDMLDQILAKDTTDISGYTELITQTSNILSDIALWLEEDKK